MEIIIAIVLCTAISLWTRFYLRYIQVEVVRAPEFERWCRSRPLVLAVHCAEGTGVDVYDALRAFVEPCDEYANRNGRYPWQHYVVRVEGKRLGPTVVALFVTGCKVQRGRPRPRHDIAEVVGGIARLQGANIVELWLHGQLHATGHRLKVDQDRLGWLGSIDDEGELDVTAMIGRPPWLQETLRPAA